MRLGEFVIHAARPYLLVGVDPMSVMGRQVELEDPENGDRSWVPFDELGEAAPIGLRPPIWTRLAERPLS
jgi:hypothetical protein